MTAAQWVAAAPQVRIETKEGVRGVGVESGIEKTPGHVSVFLSGAGEENPGQRGTMFLDMVLATVNCHGGEDFEEFAGFIRLGQLDQLIAALRLARDEAAKLGLLQ